MAMSCATTSALGLKVSVRGAVVINHAICKCSRLRYVRIILMLFVTFLRARVLSVPETKSSSPKQERTYAYDASSADWRLAV
jgi:hypothetical protein